MPNYLNRKITFGGVEVPAYIAEAPSLIRPARKIKVVSIAGSNREHVEFENAWESYDQPYTMFVADGTDDYVNNALYEVARVLYQKGQKELIDDYEPDFYRLAYFQGPFNIENRRTVLGKFTVSFRCRPERYLIAGKEPISVVSGMTLNNPTPYNAKPLVHIEGHGNGTVTVAGTTIEVIDIEDYINVDSDKLDVYRNPAENMNNHMGGFFPEIPSGDYTVTFTGGITGVTITPNYYVI